MTTHTNIGSYITFSCFTYMIQRVFLLCTFISLKSRTNPSKKMGEPNQSQYAGKYLEPSCWPRPSIVNLSDLFRKVSMTSAGCNLALSHISAGGRRWRTLWMARSTSFMVTNSVLSGSAWMTISGCPFTSMVISVHGGWVAGSLLSVKLSGTRCPFTDFRTDVNGSWKS